MSKIDILLMSDNSLDTIGGSEESTKIIIKELKNNFKIGVIQPGYIREPEDSVKYFTITSDTRLKIIFKNPIKFLNYIFTLKKIIEKQNPRIIHTQGQVNFFIVALLYKLKLIPKSIKFIHTERGLYTKYNLFIIRLFLFFMKELDVLVTTTKFNLKYWKKALTEKNIQVDFKVIENTPGKLFETFDKKLAKKRNDNLTIGFAGRYTSWKNWPLAVEISEKLNEMLGNNLKVKMAVGCLDDKSELETKEMFNKLDEIFGRRFEGKINLTLEEMSNFYYDLDVFILTSDYNTESFGRTLVEAMSRNTAVLTTNSGGSVEVVGNKNNVCNTVNQFIDRIMEFHNDKNLLELEKNRNIQRVNEKFSVKNNIEKHMKLYNSLIKCKNNMDLRQYKMK